MRFVDAGPMTISNGSGSAATSGTVRRASAFPFAAVAFYRNNRTDATLRAHGNLFPYRSGADAGRRDRIIFQDIVAGTTGVKTFTSPTHAGYAAAGFTPDIGDNGIAR